MAKVAVITGSNGLIGQATCRRLAQSGHIAVGIVSSVEPPRLHSQARHRSTGMVPFVGSLVNNAPASFPSSSLLG
jgi:NAD(P)-dependent dehydrogenase (short-subunit alcohol dehydrogenase family)